MVMYYCCVFVSYFSLNSYACKNIYSIIIVFYSSLILCTYVGRRLWGFPRFAGDCASGHKKSSSGSSSSEQKCDITDSCSQMILQLHDVYDPNKVSGLDVRMSHNECCIYMPT